MAVLGAKRAANTGLRVRLVTSTEASDDHLASVAAEHGVDCHRGSLDDVLERFVSALEGYAPDTIVVRITADNVFPDGEFIQDVLDEFLASGCDFMTTVYPGNGVPLGIAAEVTSLGLLRLSHETTTSDYDREHVMPYIERNYRVAYFRGYSHFKTSMLRCTIDYLDDYIRVCRVFADVQDPLGITCKELMRMLAEKSSFVTTEDSAAKLIVRTVDAEMGDSAGAGTTRAYYSGIVENGIQQVQIGNGKPAAREKAAKTIGKLSCDNFRVIASLGLRETLATSAVAKDCAPAMVDALLYRLCMLLRRDMVDTVLLEEAECLDALDGMAFKRLCEQQSAGRIETLGAVVRTEEQLLRVLAEPAITLVQVPFLPDTQFFHAALDRLREAGRERPLRVQACDVWPVCGGRETGDKGAADHKSWWEARCGEWNHADGHALCAAYVNALDGLDGILVDVPDERMLPSALTAYARRLPNGPERDRLERELRGEAR